MALFGPILILDDDPLQTAVLAAYFSENGAETVYEFNRAMDALAFLDGQAHDGVEPDIDLIVLDLKMPDVDGPQFLRLLKDKVFSGSIALVSSAAPEIISSVTSLAKLHGIDVIGECQKPVTKRALDSVFLRARQSRSGGKGHADVAFTRAEILSGFADGEIVPFYQPKVDMVTRKITGVEALVRWDHPERGNLSPAMFMDQIEEEGLLHELARSMITRVIHDLKYWHTNGIKIGAAVNVTSSDLAELEMPEFVKSELFARKVNPTWLTIEVTENAVLDINPVSIEILSRFRLMGIDIAIDDFGTGFSNIKALRDFPYSQLKIDQSFVRNALHDTFSQESVRSSVALGRQMNMRILAEGVETMADWDLMKLHGIDEVQGYLVSRPLSAAAFTRFYQSTGGYFDLPVLAEDNDEGAEKRVA